VEEGEGGGGLEVQRDGGFAAGEEVGCGWGWGGGSGVGGGGGAVDAEDGGAVVGEEEACEGACDVVVSYRSMGYSTG
jgi:hypothetical protein